MVTIHTSVCVCVYTHTHTLVDNNKIYEFPFIKYGINTFHDTKTQTLYNVVLASVRDVVRLPDAKLTNVKCCFDDNWQGIPKCSQKENNPLQLPRQIQVNRVEKNTGFRGKNPATGIWFIAWSLFSCWVISLLYSPLVKRSKSPFSSCLVISLLRAIWCTHGCGEDGYLLG
jgi:hypothetical protein